MIRLEADVCPSRKITVVTIQNDLVFYIYRYYVHFVAVDI
jgi:hypothetical protein